MSSKNIPGTNSRLITSFETFSFSKSLLPMFEPFKVSFTPLFSLRYFLFVLIPSRYFATPPTFFDMEHSLSLSIIIRLDLSVPALLSASSAIPPVMAPSPITATTFSSLPKRSLEAAKPRAAEIEVEACPAPKASQSLSFLLGKPDSPSIFLSLLSPSFLPVRILWTYD